MSEDKKVPKLRFSEFDGEWTVKRLSELFDIKSAGDLKKDNFSETYSPVFKYPTYANATDNKGLKGYCKEYDFSGNKITVTGRGDLGTAFFRKEPFCACGRLLILSPKLKLNLTFISEYINNKMNIYIESTGVPQLTAPNFRLYKIKIPSIDEQEKLGNFMNNINYKIELLNKKLSYFKKYKKYLLQNLFPKNGELAPKLRFKKDNGNEYSKWEEYTIKELFDVITDYVAAGSFATIKSNVKYLSEPNFAELIRTADLKSKFKNHDFVFVDEHSFNFLWRVNLNEECIVLPNIGNIGEVYFINPNNLPYKNNVLGPNSILLKSKNNIIFKYYLLSSPLFKHYLNVINESTGRGKFNKTNLKKIKTHVPLDKEEQTKISKILLFIDKKIDLIQDQIEKTEEFKKGLLQQMFV